MIFTHKSLMFLRNKLNDKKVRVKIMVALGGGYTIMSSGYEYLVSSPDAPSYAELVAKRNELLAKIEKLENLSDQRAYLKKQLDIANKKDK